MHMCSGDSPVKDVCAVFSTGSVFSLWQCFAYLVIFFPKPGDWYFTVRGG